MKLAPWHINRRVMLGVGAALPLWPSVGWSQSSNAVPIPLRDFLRLPAISRVVLSPNGKHIAGLREYGERLNITVVDLTSRKALIVTRFTDADVRSLRWVNNDRLIFTVVDRQRGSGDQVGAGLYVIDRDGDDFRQLAEQSMVTEGKKLLPASTRFHSHIFDKGEPTGDVFVEVASMQALGKFSSNVLRLNTSSGRAMSITLGGPADVRGWVIDRNNVARAATSVTGGTTRIHFRDSESDPWRVIFEFGADGVQSEVLPIAFDAAGKLYVSAHGGADTSAIYGYDPKANKLDAEPVVAVEGFDLSGGLRFSGDGLRLLGVDYVADRARTHWVDQQIAKIQAQVDRALPDCVNRLQLPKDLAVAPVLVDSGSDRDPGRYLLFDAQKESLVVIAQERPWIPVASMRPTAFFRYPARDGLQIPAQLTVPAGEGKFPLVVLHYGGPWARAIRWEWDPVVQFLVSRGYAVFMPAPRASTGFGTKLFKAGWKQWGLAMQDDVADGVRWLIAQGKIDADRICIAGASYGGYLAMMGLVKDPELYKCGINWVGVTDPSFMFSVTWTDFNRVDAGRFTLPLLIGDPVKDAEQFRRTSPVQRAAEIKQPVLMAYGGLDDRVPIVNGERLRDALKPHNQNVEWVVYPDEGHGWLKVQNNVDFWTRVEAFLSRTIGK